MDSYTITWRDEHTRPGPPAFHRPQSDHREHSVMFGAELSGAPDRVARSLVRALRSCDGINNVKITVTREAETEVDFS